MFWRGLSCANRKIAVFTEIWCSKSEYDDLKVPYLNSQCHQKAVVILGNSKSADILKKMPSQDTKNICKAASSVSLSSNQFVSRPASQLNEGCSYMNKAKNAVGAVGNAMYSEG